MPTPESIPSSYLLEKAVRSAVRRLGRSASADAIEREALSLLTEAGFQLDKEALSPNAFVAPHTYTAPNTYAAANTFGSSAENRDSAIMETDPRTWLHVSISAATSTSRRPPTQRARLYAILRSHLLPLPGDVREAASVHVRDTSILFAGHESGVLVDVVQTLEEVAADLGVPRIFGPFIDLALTENLPLLERLPEALAGKHRVCPIIQLSTPDNGYSPLAVEAAALALSLIKPGPGSSGRLLLTTNDCDRRAFGHRVHAEAVVVHRRIPVHGGAGEELLSSLPETWQWVTKADLPSIAMYSESAPTQPLVQVYPVPSGAPDAALNMMNKTLLSSVPHGARGQLALMY